ncbi:MAG: hypothetical protein ACRDZ5_07995 [Acidimicrobiales bacterium]
MSARPGLGRVVEFDYERGLGVIESGAERLAFHCTAIAGGTRNIEVGTTVAFVRAAAVGGSFEAGQLVVVQAPSPSPGGEGGRPSA